MKAINKIFAIIFFIIFFFWATKFKFWLPVSIFFPKYHILFLLFLLLFFPKKSQQHLLIVFNFLEKHKFKIFPPITFFFGLFINIFVFHKLPHIQDSINYIFMAQNFAQGHLDGPQLPFYEFFRELYIIPGTTKTFSLFLPGFSILLIPFTYISAIFLVNPILGGINVFLAGKIAQKTFNDKIATITLIITTFSPFITIMNGTFMAHTFGATLTLLSVFFFLEALKSDKTIFPFLSASSMGWLILFRPQNALFLFIAFLLFLPFNLKKTQITKKIIIFAISLLPWVLILFAYNYFYTKNPFIFKQDIYFNYSEPTNNCHRFGIGHGCHRSDWITLPKEGLTWTHAIIVSFRRLASLIMNTFAPIIFIFLTITLLWKSNKNKYFFATIFLTSFIGYFFFFFDGNVFGARYFYEVIFFLIILISAGIFETLKYKIMKIIIPSFLFATILFQIIFILPNIFNAYSHGFWWVSNTLQQEIKKKNIHNSLIFIYPKEFYASGLVLMKLNNIKNNDNIYLIDRGEKSNSAIMHYYKNRKFYKADFSKIKFGYEMPKITKISPKYDKNFIFVEMEDKFYPLNMQKVPDYCDVFPVRADLFQYAKLQILKPLKFSNNLALMCRFKNSQQQYIFGQYAPQSGKYNFEITLVKGKQMANLTLKIGKQTIDLKMQDNKQKKIVTISKIIKLKKGFNIFEIKPQIKGKEKKFFLIDKYKLEKINF